jgi:hypothetical protein
VVRSRGPSPLTGEITLKSPEADRGEGGLKRDPASVDAGYSYWRGVFSRSIVRVRCRNLKSKQRPQRNRSAPVLQFYRTSEFGRGTWKVGAFSRHTSNRRTRRRESPKAAGMHLRFHLIERHHTSDKSRPSQMAGSMLGMQVCVGHGPDRGAGKGSTWLSLLEEVRSQELPPHESERSAVGGPVFPHQTGPPYGDGGKAVNKLAWRGPAYSSTVKEPFHDFLGAPH